jgi:hypothetical protein
MSMAYLCHFRAIRWRVHRHGRCLPFGQVLQHGSERGARRNCHSDRAAFGVCASHKRVYVDGSLIGTQATGARTPTAYSQSWVTGSVAHGAHTRKVTATGANGSSSFSIPITTS